MKTYNITVSFLDTMVLENSEAKNSTTEKTKATDTSNV